VLFCLHPVRQVVRVQVHHLQAVLDRVLHPVVRLPHQVAGVVLHQVARRAVPAASQVQARRHRVLRQAVGRHPLLPVRQVAVHLQGRVPVVLQVQVRPPHYQVYRLHLHQVPVVVQVAGVLPAQAALVRAVLLYQVVQVVAVPRRQVHYQAQAHQVRVLHPVAEARQAVVHPQVVQVVVVPVPAVRLHRVAVVVVRLYRLHLPQAHPAVHYHQAVLVHRHRVADQAVLRRAVVLRLFRRHHRVVHPRRV